MERSTCLDLRVNVPSCRLISVSTVDVVTALIHSSKSRPCKKGNHKRFGCNPAASSSIHSSEHRVNMKKYQADTSNDKLLRSLVSVSGQNLPAQLAWRRVRQRLQQQRA